MKLDKFISIILLLAIGLLLMPKHFLSEHQHHHKICNELKTHLEAKDHECKFCDFVLPLSIVHSNKEATHPASIDIDVDFIYSFDFYSSGLKSLHLRGPPRV